MDSQLSLKKVSVSLKWYWFVFVSTAHDLRVCCGQGGRKKKNGEKLISSHLHFLCACVLKEAEPCGERKLGLHEQCMRSYAFISPVH